MVMGHCSDLVTGVMGTHLSNSIHTYTGYSYRIYRAVSQSKQSGQLSLILILQYNEFYSEWGGLDQTRVMVDSTQYRSLDMYLYSNISKIWRIYLLITLIKWTNFSPPVLMGNKIFSDISNIFQLQLFFVRLIFMSGQLCEHTRLIVGAQVQLLTGDRRLQYVGQERSDHWAPPASAEHLKCSQAHTD